MAARMTQYRWFGPAYVAFGPFDGSRSFSVSFNRDPRHSYVEVAALGFAVGMVSLRRVWRDIRERGMRA